MRRPTPESWKGTAAELQALHARTGLTQVEAAKQLGYADGRSYRVYLNGTRPPTLLMALAVWALGESLTR